MDSFRVLGKRVLDIKLQNNDCCPQSGNLKIKRYPALCGFISCPETEPGAAAGPQVINTTLSAFGMVSFALKCW